MTKETKSSSDPNSEGQSEQLDSPSEESLQDPESQTRETPAGQGSEEGQREETIEVGAAEGAIDFNHPLLKGKSPEEIEKIVEQQDRTIRSQNQELNDYHSKLQASSQESARPTREEPEDADPYGDTFLAPHMETFEKRMTRKMEQMVKPLESQLQAGSAESARERLRGELKHFETLEPHIDKLVRDQGADPSTADENLLRTLYYTAIGLVREQGIDLDSRSESARPSQNKEPTTRRSAGRQNEGNQNVNIPQHKPSSAPLPEGQGEGEKLRDLTEEERKMASFYGMTKEEYLKEMNRPSDEVVKPGFSKENW